MPSTLSRSTDASHPYFHKYPTKKKESLAMKNEKLKQRRRKKEYGYHDKAIVEV